MRVPIRAKLIVAILVPLSGVYLGVLALNYASGKRQAINLAQRHLTQLAGNHAGRLGSMFSVAQQAAESVAMRVSGYAGSNLPTRVNTFLDRDVPRSPWLEGACVALEPNTVPGAGAVGWYVARSPRPGNARAGQAGQNGKGRRRAGAATRPAVGPGSGPDVFQATPPEPPPDDLRPGGSGEPSSGGPPAEPPGGGFAPPPPSGGGPRGGPLERGDLAEVDDAFARSHWYLDVKAQRKAVWTAVLREKNPYGVSVCRCAVPILSDDKFLGVVAFDLNLQPLQRYVERTGIENGYGMLVAPSGLLVSHPQRGLVLKESLVEIAGARKMPDLSDLVGRLSAGKAGVTQLEDFHTLLPSFVAYAPVSPGGFSFAAVVPVESILAPVREWFRRDAAVMLGGLGVIMAVVMLVSIHITRPIQRLAEAARDLARGDLRARVRGVRNQDELGELALAFNGMVRALNRHVEARTRETAARKAVESELRVAREIQSSLLPRRFPVRREFELFAMNVPAMEVAGDFFDFFFVEPDVLAFLIADVSGKGVPAALCMAVARTVIRNQAAAGASPAEVLHRANQLIAQENERTMFVTLFFGHYHVRTGRLVYANAGHNPPCLGGADGGVRVLEGSTGPILGVFEDQTYEQREVQLLVRDSLVLYTDGVTEAMDASDRQFELAHLKRIVAGNPTASPEEMCGLVVQTVQNYRAHPQQDDVTMLVLRRNK